MAKRRNTERAERERHMLTALRALSGGRRPYADVLAEYGRLMGAGGVRVPDAFERLVQEMIAQKLIDYEADPADRDPSPRIAALWLRPRGKARLQEGGPPS